MTGLLLWKERLKDFYSRNSQWLRHLLRFLVALWTVLSINANIGYMAQLKNPLFVGLVCVFCGILPWGAGVFLMGCLMIAHVYTVSVEMALITLALILVVAVLYYGFRPGDCWLMVLTPLAFLFRMPYAVPLLVGLGGHMISVIPISCGIFLYYLLVYVKQNAGVLTGEASVDMVARYSQIVRSVMFNQTMMLMIATCAVGVIVVYLIRRMSLDHSWMIAIIAGSVAELVVIFAGDFVFGISVATVPLVAGMAASAALAAVYNFFIFTVDYTRTEYVQFEDDDYYYYVKAVPKMTVSSTDVKVKRISGRKRNTRDRSQGMSRINGSRK